MLGLRDFTPARVALSRAGNSLATAELLEFQLAHARARDAVHLPLDTPSLLLDLRRRGLTCAGAASAAHDRATYLRRPDLGRKLASFDCPAGEYDVALVIADGLSALAVHRHAIPLLDAVLPTLTSTEWRVAPIVVVEQGRVAIGDEIGVRLGAALVVALIGERPGLSAPDSLGLYLTWRPRPGLTDVDRNCISNIRTEGLSYDLAAHKLLFLMNESRRRKLSGVALKEQAAELRTLE